MINNILLFTLVLLAYSGLAYSQELTFTSINDDNGLVNNYVEHVFEDKQGFIWFGTHGGLMRYDGQRFELVPLPNQQRDISLNFARQFITCQTQDNDGNLWIGSLTGIYKYSPRTLQFTIFEHDSSDNTSLSNNYIEEIIIDNETVWVASIEGLNSINIHSGSIRNFLHNDSDPKSIVTNHIFSLAHIANGDLWVGTQEGLDRYDASSGSFVHYRNGRKGIDALNIRSIVFDSDSNLWVLSSFEGLFFKPKDSDQFNHLPIRYEGVDIVSPFSCLLDDKAGNIWIGSNGDGLYIYDKSTAHVSHYNENLSPPHNVCGNSIDRISMDNSGNIWVATHGGGVSVHKPFTNSFSYISKKYQTGNLSYNIISCFEQDSRGTLWIGTDGGGFSKRLTTSNCSFLSYDKANGLSSNAVLAISEIGPNQLAIATWNGGLNVFNTSTEKFENYYYESSRLDKNIQDIYDLYYDTVTNKLWCSTYYDGIQVFDVAKRAFVLESILATQYCYWNRTKFCNKLIFVEDGSFWMIEGEGLTKCSRKIASDTSCSNSLQHYAETEFPSDIAQFRDGSIWATNHKGVYHFDLQADTFLLFEQPGLDFTDAKSLLQDSTGAIWITTASSLIRYSPINGVFQNISQYWGIPTLQYYPKSAFRDASGNLYFGSLKGYLVLHEDSSYSKLIEPKLFVTRIIILSEVKQPELLKENAINALFLDTVSLNYDQSFISIEYGANNYIDNAKTRFKYRLYGFDKDWSVGSADRIASYTNIPPGTYSFQILSTNSLGDWSNYTKVLTIIILPPWWSTWWFLSLCALFAIAIIVLIVFMRERSIRRRNKLLETIVKDKTSELIDKNAVLTEQKMTIESSYEKLREKQLVIEIKNVQLQDALNTKDKLLTVIAHDFKNPLSTLQGLTQLLRNKIYSAPFETLKPNIDTISSSAASLMTQMIEVLDWSVCSEDSIHYMPDHIDIEVLLLDVLSLTNESAQQKNISIQTENNCAFSAYIDPRQISTVLRNLIINSLKFTPKNGLITIFIEEYLEIVRITVSDTGQGMNAEQIDAIMTSKKLLSSDYQSGFGLQICKTFISRNSGAFHIKSQEAIGTQFFIDLPKGRRLDYNVKLQDQDLPNNYLDIDFQISDKTILIIDDEADVTTYLREIFSQSYHVIVAYNGSEGLQLAQKHLPDIILSDINMPKIDGKQLCQQLKNDNLTSHIPVILISGQALPKNQIDGFLHGADDYIIKPFNIDLLRHKVVAILSNRELIIQRFAQQSTNLDTSELPLSVDDKIINDINAIIMENLTNAVFSVEALAEAANMSRSQLYRKLKAVVGQTPIEYINNLKFSKAMEMIKTGRYRVSEVAYELGFSDVRHFSLSFSKKYGGPPSSFYPKQV